jgi:radical SAM protein with 4Fe4S-binding SPASM domain
MISTNGDYFKSVDDIVRLLNAGLNQIQINIYNATDNSPSEKARDNGIAKAKERSELMREWVKQLKLMKYLDAKDYSMYQNIGPRKRTVQVIDKFGVSVEDNGVIYSNRSGLVPDYMEALKEPMKKYCTRPFRFLNINWKGQSLLCCNDFYGQTNFGNIKDTTLEDMWNHKTYHQYRLRLQNSNRNMSLCDKCNFNGGSYPHMITEVTFGKEEDKKVLTEGHSIEKVFRKK